MPASATCSTGQSNDASAAGTPFAPVANAVALTITSGGCAASAVCRKLAERASLRLVRWIGTASSPRAPSAAAERLDRRGGRAREQRAIEQHRGDRTPGAPRLGRPEPRGRHRPCRGRPLAAPDQVRRKAQRETGILDAAFGAVAPQRVRARRVERAARRERGVPLQLAGQAGERDAARERIGAQALDPMRPVALAAEQAQEHDPGARERARDIEVDRQRMAEREEIGELHRRKVGRQRSARRRERREIGVGRRQHHDVGGLLAEIARDLAVIDRSRGVELEVHRYPPNALRTASRSKPLSPITTRCSPTRAASGRANDSSTRPPTACTTTRPACRRLARAP